MGPLIVITTTSNYLNVSTLEPHTHYRFTVSARTSQGEGPLSNYTLFLTHQDGMCLFIIVYFIFKHSIIIAPVTAPINMHVTENSLSANSFGLEWQSPSNRQLNGLLMGYIVMVVELNTGTIYTNFTPTPSIVINSLHPYYTYNCSVAAVTVATGPFSENIMVQTAQNGR